MKIIQETPNNYDAVYNLVKSAFATAEHSDGKEQYLVNRLRKSDAFVPELSLIAEIDNKIVGHIMFTKIKINGSVALALAPLSVAPDFQKQGIGTALMNAGIDIAKSMGYNLVIVLGSEKYYPRVGFVPASNYNISAPFEVPNENFMALSLDQTANIPNGTVEYAKEFFEE